MEQEVKRILVEINDWSLEGLHELKSALDNFIQTVEEDAQR